MTDDVARLIERLKLGRTHLIGHSLGALLAVNVAERYPDRVASLSLLAGMFFRDSATFATWSNRWASELEATHGMTKFLQWCSPAWIPPPRPASAPR
jgi:pimeloyl-ACP methyl ester carboxylesterase